METKQDLFKIVVVGLLAAAAAAMFGAAIDYVSQRDMLAGLPLQHFLTASMGIIGGFIFAIAYRSKAKRWLGMVVGAGMILASLIAGMVPSPTITFGLIESVIGGILFIAAAAVSAAWLYYAEQDQQVRGT